MSAPGWLWALAGAAVGAAVVGVNGAAADVRARRAEAEAARWRRREERARRDLLAPPVDVPADAEELASARRYFLGVYGAVPPWLEPWAASRGLGASGSGRVSARSADARRVSARKL